MKKPAWARSTSPRKRSRTIRTQPHRHRWGAPVAAYGRHWVFRCVCGEIGYGVPE